MIIFVIIYTIDICSAWFLDIVIATCLHYTVIANPSTCELVFTYFDMILSASVIDLFLT